MKESKEKIIKLGFERKPRYVFDEIERTTAEMIREGWEFSDSCMEEGLGQIHLFFTREVKGV